MRVRRRDSKREGGERVSGARARIAEKRGGHWWKNLLHYERHL